MVQFQLGREREGLLFVGGLLIALTVATGMAVAEQPILELVKTIRLKGAEGPLDHLLVDTAHARLLVANQSNDTLDVVDLKAGKLVKQVPGQKKIHGIAYAPDLNRIYLGNGEGVCNVLDGKSYELLKTIPVADADNVRYDPGTHRVYVAGENSLAVIDGNSLKLIAAIKLPGSPEGFLLEPKRSRLYVNTSEPNQVVVVDTKKHEITQRYPLKEERNVETLVIDKANRRLMVGFRKKPSIVILDSDSGKEVANVGIPDGIDDMFFDPRSKRIYASCGSGFVAVVRQIDADHYESQANIATIKGAKTCFFDDATQRLYLAVPRQEGKDGAEIWVYQAKR
jgi:DNA-binding beta-propeller fold protein YncE